MQKKTSTVVVSLCITLMKMICLVQREYVKMMAQPK
ncbi:ORF191 [Staphylococcus phage X2]|uniref:ORF191 n=1 Tax=Staphylococcus phage X2 TaxID=2908152 RepID=Q4ZAA6_9CAUD|nr:ORF191 [Staphylococcus phage X2]AAX92081.1 ORF191 [Staphylococcus phage X2]